MFFKQIITYNDKFTLFSGVKIFWIVLNNKIFYLSTLYTNINYNKLKLFTGVIFIWGLYGYYKNNEQDGLFIRRIIGFYLTQLRLN